MAYTGEALQAERLGLIKDLAELLQQQHQLQNKNSTNPAMNVSTVEQLTQTLTAKIPSSTEGLCMSKDLLHSKSFLRILMKDAPG